MSVGLKVGTDLENNTDDELVYSSEWNNWKIFDEKTKALSVPADYNNYSTDAAHGLSYTPAVEVWAEVDGKIFTVPGYDNTFSIAMDYTIDATNIYFYAANFTDPPADKTVTFCYTVYYERLDQ